MKQEKVFQIKVKWLIIIGIIVLVLVISSGGYLFWKSKDNQRKLELSLLQQSFTQQIGTKATNVQFGKQKDIYYATCEQDGVNYLLENIAGVWKVYVQTNPQAMSTPAPNTTP